MDFIYLPTDLFTFFTYLLTQLSEFISITWAICFSYGCYLLSVYKICTYFITELQTLHMHLLFITSFLTWLAEFIKFTYSRHFGYITYIFYFHIFTKLLYLRTYIISSDHIHVIMTELVRKSLNYLLNLLY